MLLNEIRLYMVGVFSNIYKAAKFLFRVAVLFCIPRNNL